MNTLPARFTHPHAELPTRAHPTDAGLDLSLIHISEPTRRHHVSRMPSSA